MSVSQAAEGPLFVICYDVGDDRERRRVDKLLLGYGHRSQRSVFECHLGAAAHKRLKQQMEQLGLRTGHVRMYRVYANGAGSTIGVPPENSDEVYCYSV